jgi:hypothetical protein
MNKPAKLSEIIEGMEVVGASYDDFRAAEDDKVIISFDFPQRRSLKVKDSFLRYGGIKIRKIFPETQFGKWSVGLTMFFILLVSVFGT